MSALHLALADCLRLRRSLGFRLHDAGLKLPRFVDFLADRDIDHVTIPLTLELAQLPTTVLPWEWTRRLGHVRVRPVSGGRRSTRDSASAAVAVRVQP